MNRTLMSASLALTLSLTACQPETELAPKTLQAGLRPGASEADVATPVHLPYKLIKHGDYTLAYELNGRLSSVQGPASTYTTYEEVVEKGSKTIIARRYQRGALTKQTVHTLDTKGRATAMVVTTYLHPANGFGINEMKEVYAFQLSQVNPGKLSQINLTRTLGPTITKESWVVYDYTNNTDINSLTRFMADGGQEVFHYEYLGSANDSKPMADQNHLNTIFLPFLDPYLDIYSYLNTHLATRVFISDGQLHLKSQTNYTYTLHNDGTIRQLDRFDGSTGKLLDSTPFGYGL